MRTSVKIIFVWLLAMASQSCYEDESFDNNGNIQFDFNFISTEVRGGRIGAVSLPGEAMLLVSVETTTGKKILTRHEIKLLKIGDGYVSDPLSLAPGLYRLTEFILANSNREVLYATPLTGSPLAQAVTHSLPFNFNIVKNRIITIPLEVVDALKHMPKDFGFVTFTFKEVMPFQVSVFINQDSKLVLTTAKAFILDGNDTIKKYSLRAGINAMSVEDQQKKYSLIIVKDGFVKYSHEFYINNLLSELNNEPLKVILTKGIVANGDFEMGVDFTQNSIWTKNEYLTNQGLFTWAKDIGKDNSGGISLEARSGAENDMAIMQKVNLDPNKFYRLSAWVKTTNIKGGAGANVCLYGTWTSSGTLTGSNDWQEIGVDIPPGSPEITIACRLGYWGGVSSGKAYFDNVTIKEVDKYVGSGQHIRLIADREDASGVSEATISAWIANLDKAYVKYYELMGAYPSGGQTITILSVDTYPGGWAVAGNPILWYKPYIKSELQTIQNTGSWSFGIMHELGHDFALENVNKNWIWHEEMFANFRMYYVVEQLNSKIFQGELYTGSQLKYYYKTNAGESYDKGIAQGKPVGYDGLMYTLIRIKDKIGWQPFIDTYKNLNASSVAPSNRWDSFNLFLDKLTYYSGQNVRATYLPGESDTIKKLLLQ